MVTSRQNPYSSVTKYAALLLSSGAYPRSRFVTIILSFCASSIVCGHTYLSARQDDITPKKAYACLKLSPYRAILFNTHTDWIAIRRDYGKAGSITKEYRDIANGNPGAQRRIDRLD